MSALSICFNFKRTINNGFLVMLTRQRAHKCWKRRSHGSDNLVFKQIPGAFGVVKLGGCVEVGQHAHSPHQDWGQEKCDLKYEMIYMWTKTKIVIFWSRDRWPTRTETQTEMGIRGSQSQPNSSPLSLVRGPSWKGLVDRATIASLVLQVSPWAENQEDPHLQR